MTGFADWRGLSKRKAAQRPSSRGFFIHHANDAYPASGLAGARFPAYP
ncbi:hypothetical protein HMPREF9946_04425 [Acetobacteraceae bacterium AT-5844]|nr:hypothetical protein HMPREF9946_04425 [Acetobacteraceae bacterium AT-5844]